MFVIAVNNVKKNMISTKLVMYRLIDCISLFNGGATLYAIFSILYNCLQLMSFYTLVGTCTYGMVPLQHPRHWRLYSEQIYWIFRNRSENIFQFILESLFFQVTMFCPFADVYICFFRNIFIRKRYVNYTNINFCSIVLKTYSSGVWWPLL